MRILQEEYAKDKHYALLKDDLHQTARALQDAYNNLENVVDPDLIDCYIYELNSVQFSTRSPFPYVYPAYTCWVFFIIGAEESVSATLQKL